jgi:hypothetical protein
MNIDMRNIPEEFEANIREIMELKNIPASKALIWALEDRKKLENEIEKLEMKNSNLKNEIRDLTAYKDCVLILKETLSRNSLVGSNDYKKGFNP